MISPPKKIKDPKVLLQGKPSMEKNTRETSVRKHNLNQRNTQNVPRPSAMDSATEKQYLRMVAEQPIGKILDKICLCFVKLSPLHLQWMKLKAFANCDDCLQIFDEEILVLVSNHPSAVLLKNSRSHTEVWRMEGFIYIYIYYILSLNTFSIIMRERV